MRYVFGDFTLDLDRFELQLGGRAVPLERRSFDLLRYLVEQRDRTVPKDELMTTIWPNVIVTDASLSTAIAQVRRALGDDGKAQKWVRTVRGRGFRFLGKVQAGTPRETVTSAQGATAPSSDAAPPSARPAIAVLPFKLLSAAVGETAIAEAVPAELIATLSRLRWLKVIARGSSFRFAADHPDLSDIRSALGASYVLTGAVEPVANQLTITVELTDTRTQEIIWAESFTAKREDVFHIREQIARQTVGALEIRVPLNESERLSHMPSESLDAWGHYHLSVRHMQSYDRAKNLIAEGHLKQALMLDPSFARAEAALAYTEFQNHFQMFGTDTSDHRDQSLKHAERAIELDPLDPFCALNYGRAKWLFGEVEEGLDWAERSLSLNPNYAFGFYNSAIFHNILCHGETSDVLVGDALDLSPLDPHLQSMLATRALAAFLRGDIRAALSLTDQSLRAPNPHLYVFAFAAFIYHRTGQAEKAARARQNILDRGVPFSRQEFLFHYNLRDPDRRAELEHALIELGI